MTDLKPGESRSVRIDSRMRNNETGIRMHAGATYECVASGRWHDASNECDADGYDIAKLRMWIFLRRVRKANWFKLIGVIDGEQHILGTRATITPTKSGELVCFANDVAFMYGNNKGAIELTVTRRS